MVEQVKVVTILMIIYGALLAVAGLFLAGLGPFFYYLETTSSVARKRDEAGMTVMMIVLLVIGFLVLAIGILHIIAGMRGRNFQGRILDGGDILRSHQGLHGRQIGQQFR